jgi:hypothetical protein
MLPVLPIASLPMLWLSRAWPFSRAGRAVLLVGVSVVLCWSASRQLVVNSVEWFAPFRAEALLADNADERVRCYFRQPYWVIEGELLAMRVRDRPFPALEAIRDQLPAARYIELRQCLGRIAMNNLFWSTPVAPSRPNPPSRREALMPR